MDKTNKNPESFYDMSGSSPPDDSSSPKSKWMNSAEAAKYLGIARKTIYNIRNGGVTLGTRMNGSGKLVFLKEDLDAYVLGKLNKTDKKSA